MPLDVWSSLLAANAFLYVITDDGDDVGFVVLRTVHDCDGPYLFVWCLWSEPDAMRHCWRDVIAKLDELATRVGAKRIRMESPREAWRWGSMFDPVATIYQREVKL